MSDIVYFDKYDAAGAYHWAECDRRYANWKRYNPALDARYELTRRAVGELGLRGCLVDVGCGDGVLMGRLASIFDRVIGVEADARAVGLAREMLMPWPNCTVLHVETAGLPLEDASADVITSADVIEHLTDPAQHLRDIGRVLKPGGALVLTTPQWRADGRWDSRHEREYRSEELRALLLEHFREVELRYYWPAIWSRFYATRPGWRLLKLMAIQLYNPFLRISATGRQRYGQLLAVCRHAVR